MPRIKEKLLIPREKYLVSGCHIGVASKTASMRRFIYRIRPNGLVVLNIGILDKRIECAANMIAQAKNPLVVCRKEIGWDPVKKFTEIIGGVAIIDRFMPGSLTNPTYKHFFEPDLLIVIDPLADKQAMKEAVKIRIPIISLADTSHNTAYIDLVLPVNNKGKKSIALVLWGIAKEVARIRGTEFNYTLEDFGWE